MTPALWRQPSSRCPGLTGPASLVYLVSSSEHFGIGAHPINRGYFVVFEEQGNSAQSDGLRVASQACLLNDTEMQSKDSWDIS